MIYPSPPNNLPDNSTPTSNTVAHALGESVNVNGSNRPTTVVTQSQTNFSQSSTPTGDNVNPTAAVYGDQLSPNSIDNNDLDVIPILSCRIHLDNDPPLQSIQSNNVPLLDATESTEPHNATKSTEPYDSQVGTTSSPTFAEENESYIPPSMDHLPPIPPFVNAAIRAMLFHVWCIQFPRDYQIEAIFFLVFLKVGCFI